MILYWKEKNDIKDMVRIIDKSRVWTIDYNIATQLNLQFYHRYIKISLFLENTQ